MRSGPAENSWTPENPVTFEKLDEYLAFVKAEVKGYSACEDVLSVEMKDTNRPDLWSAEGLARGLRCYLGLEKGLKAIHCGEISNRS